MSSGSRSNVPFIPLASVPPLQSKSQSKHIKNNNTYLGYINLYAQESKFRQRLKRGNKQSFWVKKLKIHDKIDIYDKKDKGWHIGTIIKIENVSESECIKLTIHYDGWSVSYDEIIPVNLSKNMSYKLRKLHTYTPIHNNLECKWTKSSQWKVCKICRNKFCTKCAIITIPETQYQSEYEYEFEYDHDNDKFNDNKTISICEICSVEREKEIIFHSLYDAIKSIDNDDGNMINLFMDINLIHLITDYSTGSYAICCNNLDSLNICNKEICCDSRYQFEMLYNYENNKIYHYIPNTNNNEALSLQSFPSTSVSSKPDESLTASGSGSGSECRSRENIDLN